MLVSTKGRYALRVMVDLVECGEEGRVPLKHIAARQDISEKYLENILASLVRAGLLSGMRGKGGGYRLARPASEISVGEVLRLTEGTLSPVACLEAEHEGCPRSGTCRTIKVWTELDRLISGYLDGVMISDLACERAAEDEPCDDGSAQAGA